jgi:hypothetical protein
LPTKWTAPLQWVVIVAAVLSFGLIVATGPFVLSLILAMPQPVAVPPSGVSPGEAEQMARTSRIVAIGSIAFEGLIAVALLVLVVVGALKRRGWAFWLALVLNGFSALGFVVSMVFAALALVGVSLPRPPGVTPASIAQPPVAFSVAGPIVNVAQALTFVALLLAAIRIGPWACRYEVSEETPPDREGSHEAPEGAA